MLLLIGLSLCAQLLLYILFRKQKYIKVIILLLFLFLNLYLFPRLSYEQMFDSPEDMDHPRCGMPIVFLYFMFWLIGGGLTLVMHVCYWLCSRRPFGKKKKTLPEF